MDLAVTFERSDYHSLHLCFWAYTCTGIGFVLVFFNGSGNILGTETETGRPRGTYD